MNSELAKLKKWIQDLELAVADNHSDRVNRLLYSNLFPNPETANHCRFLTAYKEDKSSLIKDVATKLIGDTPFQLRDQGWQIEASKTSIIHRLRVLLGNPPDLLRGLELRLAMLWLLDNQKALRQKLPGLLAAYQEFFDTEPWEQWGQVAGEYSAAGTVLEGSNKELANSIFQAVSDSELSFLDPAVAFLVDSIAIACDCVDKLSREIETEKERDLSRWLPGDTWVLFVANQDGLLMRLRMERVVAVSNTGDPQRSSGACYPHPHLAAHFKIKEDFQVGIRNAWIAFQSQLAAGKIIGDLRWSLIPVEQHERELCLQAPLTGESASLAYASALKSAFQRESLARNIAATAKFVEPDHGDRQKNNPVLATVRGVPEKLNKALESKKIKHLVVASGQTSDDFLPGGSWKEQTTFDDAYRCLREQEQFLEGCANWFAGRWDRIVQAGKSDDGT